MRTRSEAKKAERLSTTPRKVSKVAKANTPKSERKKRSAETPLREKKKRDFETPLRERKKESETPLRIDDLISSQHFGSQVEVGWDCNSPDALRNIQRYRGEHDTEISEIVMRLLDEEPQERHSPSQDNLTRVSPPPLGLWKGTSDPVRPPKRLRPRRKSGDVSSIQDTLYESLRNAIEKCETILETDDQPGNETEQSKPRECQTVPSDQVFEVCDDLNEDKSCEDKTLLNCSKDLFDSTRIKALENEEADDTVADNNKTTVNNDEVDDLDKSDATWSDDEMFDDSFIIKATQFPETLKTFKSPLIGMKRKPPDEGLSSRSKSPRYSFQLHPKTDFNSNKVRGPVSKTTLSVTGRPPTGLSKCASTGNATNLSLTSKLPNSINTCSAIDKPHSFTNSLAGKPKEQTVPSKFVGTVRNSARPQLSSTNKRVQSKLTDSVQCRTESVKVSQSSKFSTGTSIGKPPSVTSLPAQTGPFTISRNSSFRKHNSFNGQESPKSGPGAFTRQRSFSGTTKDPCSSSSSVTVSNKVKPIPVSNTRVPAQNNFGSMSAVQTSKKSVLNTSTVASFYSKSKPCATITPSVFSKPVTVNSARNSEAIRNSAVGLKVAMFPKSTSSSVSNPTVKTVGSSKSSLIVSCTATTATSVLLPDRSHASTVSSSISLNNDSKCYSAHTGVKTEGLEDSFEESPVFGAKKRLSTGAFDTSLTDELLCKLAEPDDLLDSQMCDMTFNPDTKQASNRFTTNIPNVSKAPNVLTLSKPSSKTATKTAQNFSKNVTCSNVNPVNNLTLSSRTDEKRTFSFKTSQKPSVISVRQSDVKSVENDIAKDSLSVFRKPTNNTGKSKITTEAPVSVVNNQCSEDLFGSDDDDFLADDGLTEPEILAMLDEVEFLATQQMKTSQESKVKVTHIKTDYQDQWSPPCTPTKYSPSDIEKKKQEALKKRENKQRLQNSQECKVNTDTCFSPKKCEYSSQENTLTPTKCSPQDIEKKRQIALEKRQKSKAAQQLNFSQESEALNIGEHSPSKFQQLSHGHSSSQSGSDRDFDNSQNNLCSPTKYSSAEIEMKRQEAMKRRELSSSQESKLLQGHSPVKDMPLSQGQCSSQRSDGANSTQIQSSPVKYSQIEIERKKQEALKRRKLKLSSAHRKDK